MRPIKFRFRSCAGMHEVVEIDFKNQKVWLSDGDQRDIASGILMQFTGLLDKNGREIYEGDIVEREEKNYEVVRDEQYLEYAIYGDGEQYKMDVGLKVILRGNIYETSELLDE